MKDKLISGIGSRVRAVRQSQDMNQKEFSSKLDVSPSYLSEIEGGKTKPSLNFLVSLYLELDVNPGWLLVEFGEMFVNREPGRKICEYDIGDQNDMLHQLLSIMERSIYFRDMAMSDMMRSFYRNESIIKKDIEKDSKLLD